jgi:hypothetical protein
MTGPQTEGEEEEVIIKTPPKKVLGFALTSDPLKWWKKWSTWCGWVAAGCAGSLGFYALAPARAQALVPDAALVTVMVLGMLSGFAVAVATKIRQPQP